MPQTPTTHSPANPAPLTFMQKSVLDYLRAYLLDNHCLPSTSAIAGAFGFASNNAASDHLARLEAKGWLKRNEIRKLMLAHRVDMAFELPPHRAPAPAAQATAAWHAASLMPHRQQVAA